MNESKSVQSEYSRLARQIPVGMQNIDRMRKEIHDTIQAVLGLVEPYHIAHINHGKLAITPMLVASDISTIDEWSEVVGGYLWRIQTSRNGELVVSCWEEISTGRQLVYSKEIAKVIRLQHVNGVYATMGSFIASMHKIFPKLIEDLKPLVDAASVNLN